MTPTNEAGHGLPELPEPAMTAFTKADGVTPFWHYDGVPLVREGRRPDSATNKAIYLYTTAQVQQYARDYAAALALSRGVPDAVASRLRGLIAEIDSHRKPATGELRLVADELKSILALAAAPAAAGAQGEEYQRGYAQGVTDTQKSPKYDSTGDTVYTQPAVADGGVRERALELLAAEYAKDTDSMLSLVYAQRLRINDRCEPWAKELSALEQALTQQPALSSHRQAGDDLSKFRELVERWQKELDRSGVSNDEYNHGFDVAKSGCLYELKCILALVEKGAGNG